MTVTQRKREITPDDLISMEQYGRERKARRHGIVAFKKLRRVEVGPFCTFHFENYETMWLQVQEMLFIEKGGEDQIADELSAYNPLIPKGRELVATVMFEIAEEARRRAFLAKLGGIEETAFFRFGQHKIIGRPEDDVDRTTADGKASSVQFIHFPFSDTQVEAFSHPDAQVTLGFAHPQYGHMVVLPPEVRRALSQDFD